MKKNLPYSEGTAFGVPLRNTGYGRGVVARTAPGGIVLFGYFFGPRLQNLGSSRLDELLPDSAVARYIFGDLGLVNGEWPILGQLPNWRREAWRMPDFIRRDPLSKRAWRVRYHDDDPSQLASEEPIEFDADLPPNLSSGHGAVEVKLSRLLPLPPSG